MRAGLGWACSPAPADGPTCHSLAFGLDLHVLPPAPMEVARLHCPHSAWDLQGHSCQHNPSRGLHSMPVPHSPLSVSSGCT